MSRPTDVQQIVSRPVFVRDANRPFGELTAGDVARHADDLAAAVGWGPTARIAPVARAWRELAIALRAAGADTVAELDPATLQTLAPRLWITLPGI